MNILFLAGNSLRHKAWIHDMADQLQDPFDTSVVHEYKHWQTGEPWVDMDYEVAEVTKKMQDLAPYVVFAKSIGTMVALRAMHEGTLRPKACVFLGLPLNAATDMNLPVDSWLSTVSVPVYFAHNDHDPYGSAKELAALLPSNIDQSRVTVFSDNTHDYLDTKVMAEQLALASS